MSQILGAVLMLLGAGLTFLAGIGLVRLPTGLSRLHAAAKPASLGLALVALGAGVASGSWGLAATGVLIAFLQFLTAPIAGHLLGRTLSPESEELVGEEGTLELEMRPARSRRWTLVIVTALVWIVLWRDLSLANLLAGAALGVILALVAPPTVSSRIHPLGAVLVLSRYALDLARANVRMAYQVLAVDEAEVQETLVVCDLETRSESVAFFDANATSFSPGTITLEISGSSPYRMVVHAIGQSSAEVTTDVSDLETSASRMFGRRRG